MQLRFVGCGDAFGSGARFNTCFHVTGMLSRVADVPHLAAEDGMVVVF